MQAYPATRAKRRLLFTEQVANARRARGKPYHTLSNVCWYSLKNNHLCALSFDQNVKSKAKYMPLLHK